MFVISTISTNVQISFIKIWLDYDINSDIIPSFTNQKFILKNEARNIHEDNTLIINWYYPNENRY